ncbi:adducin 1-like protein hts isoform X2 [Arctopsyche grandis]|uniref:adducin 1-like protein hts isoform X2 n=1 Tax=Arctopsyche grandis TaxID=121162 RepID=UPI00406D9835
MADTSQSEADPPITNGVTTEDEDERLKQRPADIDADVREMERRKRVEMIMSSKLFREELERILDAQLREGGGAGILQQISDMMGVPASRVHAGTFKNSNCVLPINDIRGMDGMGYAKGEKILRCKLAALYRLMDLYGWTQGVDNQITGRLNADEEVFLTAPRGLLCHEVTASSLAKVDMQGAIVDHGTTNFPVNPSGFMLHSWVHAARPDIRCIIQVRAPAVLAIGALRSGLLPLTREAALLGDVPAHQLAAGVLDPEEREKLVRSFGPHSKVLLLQGGGGGALCCGGTAEEAWMHARYLTAAADAQTRLAHLPPEALITLGDEARKQIYDAARRPPADAGPKWRVGGEEFEALMRMLDNAGFRTGYIYRQPLIKGDVPKPRNDIEVPPAVSSLGYLLEEEELYRQGLWKKMEGGRKAGDRSRWLNSPNVYQKVEVLETGTSDPKKITKWVSDDSPSHTCAPVKIDAAMQFVPKNTNPKEFKQLQQQIKDYRRADKISAGPQSHILEGVTWDEANKIQDAGATHTGDHVVLMGAASKGIIQRGHQHNATVYKAPYARNPFDAVTDDEINEYKRTVERKARGEYDTDYSESEALSGAQIMSPSEAEDESRTEARVLRIETKQAPRPSQPEVVLSDVNADFMNMERSTAESYPRKGENTLNGDHSDAHASTFSHSSKEGSPSKDMSLEESPKKDKKKKKGLRTPSFLKKKKEKKKQQQQPLMEHA